MKLTCGSLDKAVSEAGLLLKGHSYTQPGVPFFFKLLQIWGPGSSCSLKGLLLQTLIFGIWWIQDMKKECFGGVGSGKLSLGLASWKSIPLIF